MGYITDTLAKPIQDHIFKKILEVYTKEEKTPFFVQIGAYDGISNDPVYPHLKNKRWKGILIEPVPYIFNRLLESYKERFDLAFPRS